MPIIVDGVLNDWPIEERLEISGTPAEYEFYAKAVDGIFYVALKAPDAIGPKTTIWLDTDLDSTTGFKVFGFAGGAEYNINFALDGKPYLYSGADGENYISELDYAFGSGGNIVEVAVPLDLIGNTNGDANILIDVNNVVFLPNDYTLPAYAAPAGRH